jgi:hypothetical protein
MSVFGGVLHRFVCVFHRFSTGSPQVFHRFSTGFPQVLHRGMWIFDV